MRRILPETIILGVLGTLDNLSTVWLLHSGLAVEANPLLSWASERSLLLFFIVKMAAVLGPLAWMEFLHNKQPESTNFLRSALRVGIAAYVMIYVACTLTQFMGS